MMTDFASQASALVHDNRRLRVRVDNDAHTITTLKQQYDVLAADFKDAQQAWREREHALITERDRAVTSHNEIVGLLNQAADLIVQAAMKRSDIKREPAGDDATSQPMLESSLRRIRLDTVT